MYVAISFIKIMVLKFSLINSRDLLPTGSEERGVLGVRSIPVVILPSCQLWHYSCINMDMIG